MSPCTANQMRVHSFAVSPVYSKGLSRVLHPAQHITDHFGDESFHGNYLQQQQQQKIHQEHKKKPQNKQTDLYK